MEDERWLMMAVLDHLQTASQRDEMNAAPLQEAIFAISNAYSLNMHNAATRQRYPLHHLSLVDVFKAGRQQLLHQPRAPNGRAPNGSAPEPAASRAHAPPHRSPPPATAAAAATDATDADYGGFDHFLQRLKHSTSLFEGLEQDSPEYQRRVQRARQKYDSKRAAKRMKAASAAPPASASAAEARAAEPSAAHKQRAEALKQSGNHKLKDKCYEEALHLYDQSIKLWPQNAVYHSNRAAANMLLRRFEEAVKDCRTAIELDASFMRPRERLAHAYRQLGHTADEVHALKQALRLDGSNENVQRQLNDAEQRLRARNGGGAAAPNGSAAAAEIPALQNILAANGGNMEQMMSRIGRDGVSNMANMLGINVPGEMLDELFENGGLQQMQDMMSRNPEMLQQTMQSLMRGELFTPPAQDGGGGGDGNGSGGNSGGGS